MITDQVKMALRQNPRLKKVAHWLGIKSQSDWLFTKDVIQWITDPYYKKQLPFSWQLFASYCQMSFPLAQKKKIVGAKPLYSLLMRLQRIVSPQGSTKLRFPDLEAFLDMEDPRFLVVGNELIKGDIGKILSSFIGEGDTFLDIGANQGAYSLIASNLVGVSGLVVSIEPQPKFASNIKKSLALNPQHKFQVHQMAVGNFNGTIDLVIPHSYSGTAGVYSEHSGRDRHRKLQVPIRCFDDSIDWQNFPGSVFLKLDIEGAEFAFLKGAEKMVATLTPTLLMEINPSSMRASRTEGKDLVALLMKLGYTHFRRLDDLVTFYALEKLKTNRFLDQGYSILFSC